jgi:chromosome segregation ATPase
LDKIFCYTDFINRPQFYNDSSKKEMAMPPNGIEYEALKQKLAGDVNYASAHAHALDHCPDLTIARDLRLHRPLLLVLKAIHNLKPDLTPMHDAIATLEKKLQTEISSANSLCLKLRAQVDQSRSQKQALEEELAQLQSQQKALQKQHHTTQKQKEKAEDHIAQLNAKKEELDEKKNQLHNNIEALDTQASQANIDKDKLERQHRELPGQEQGLRIKRTQTREEITNLDRQLRYLHQQQDTVNFDLGRARRQRQEAESDYSQAEKELRDWQTKLTGIGDQIKEMNRKMVRSTDHQEQLDRLKQDEERLKAELLPLRHRESELKRKLDPLRRQEADINQKFESLGRQEQDLARRLSQLREQDQALEAKQNSLAEQEYTLNQQLDEVRSKIRELKQASRKTREQDGQTKLQLDRISKLKFESTTQLNRFKIQEETVDKEMVKLEQKLKDLNRQLTEIEQLEKTYTFTNDLVQELNLLLQNALLKGTAADTFDLDHQRQYLHSLISNIKQAKDTLTRLSKEIDNSPDKGVVLHDELRLISAQFKDLAKTKVANDLKLVVKQLAEFESMLRKASKRATPLNLEQAYERIIKLNDNGKSSRVLPRLIEGHKIISQAHISGTQKEFLYRYLRLCALALTIEALAANNAQAWPKRAIRTVLKVTKLGQRSLPDRCLDLYVQLAMVDGRA